MGSNNEFGPDTESIKAWLAKRGTYAQDARVVGSPLGTIVAEPDAPAQPDGNDTGRSILEALGTDAPPAPSTPRTTGGSVDGNDLGRSIVDAIGGVEIPAATDPEAEPDAAPESPAAPAPERHSGPPAVRHVPAPARRHHDAAPQGRVHLPPVTDVSNGPQVPQGRWTEPAENLVGTTNVDFPVKAGVRRAMSLILLASLAATGWAGYTAAQDPMPTNTGIAGVLGFLTLVVWAVRAGATSTQLSVRRGQLTVKRGGRTEVVDVASPYTPIAIVGEPGDRRWTVLIERPGQPLLIVTRSWVDPEGFTQVLYRLRPGLRPEYAGASTQ